MFSAIDIDHLVLICSSLETSQAFYTQVLGARFERRLDSPRLLQLRFGSALIDLVPRSDQPAGLNMAHFCLNIAAKDEASVLQHLEQHGVHHEGFSEKYGARGYSRSIYIYDPDGNQVELKLLSRQQQRGQ
ncbi:VOC family protein [Shewanella chilikensis]|uniref:VOC family protein n=1 Tax=Shewanella chilikensis TaxID=558541 RepID=UPI003B675AEB